MTTVLVAFTVIVPGSEEQAQNRLLARLNATVPLDENVQSFEVVKPAPGTERYGVWIDDHETRVFPLDSVDVVDVPSDRVDEWTELADNGATLAELQFAAMSDEDKRFAADGWLGYGGQ